MSLDKDDIRAAVASNILTGAAGCILDGAG